MGMRYDELYGNRAAGTDAQQLVIRVPRNAPAPAPYQVPFVVRSVRVENPSGIWYSVNGEQVPPWTIGAVLLLRQPGSTLAVEVSTPSGQVSEDVGDDLTIVAMEALEAPSPGVLSPQKLFDIESDLAALSGAVADVKAAVDAQALYDLATFEQPQLSAFLTVRAEEGGSAFQTLVGAPGAGNRIVITGIGVAGGSGGGVSEELRALATVSLLDPAIGTRFLAAVSPASPNFYTALTPGSWQWSDNQPISVSGGSQPGGGIQQVAVFVTYYVWTP